MTACPAIIAVMISLEPLGTGVFLPAILIGYEAPGAVSLEHLNAALPPDGAIVRVFQQAGGDCMSYPTAFGALLRLEANRGRDGGPLDVLVRGLKAMSEDPDMETLRQYPVLRALVGTSGRSYESSELDSLARYLERFFDVPAFVSGLEAFVCFAPCDALEFFGGWNVLTCRLPTHDDARLTIYADTPGHHFDESNASELIRDDIRVFDAERLRAIADLGQRLGLPGRPSAFLSWENCE
ncbi:hypothetical protein SAMN02745121_00900 [Nannocystis exedens]|uniref:Uncharacterized protein n=2 Tax=Nannocystis exedens TaxID=54 RepID=A0A1I1U1L3_9BACT|nr:hypothetical protein NAEX_04435 [Nannocystis exedens]SFD64761.1 hypothetical protein SAMN02745121_00900 [Nannocystis exedens]